MATPATITAETAIQQSIAASIAVKQAMLADHELLRQISAAAEMIVTSLRAGGRVLLAGNGGSAAGAQHIASEFLGRQHLERRAMPAMALTGNSAALTSIGNDYGFDEIFARQVEGFAHPGDVLIALSTSGNSRNLLRALLMAGALRMKTVALAGHNGGKLKNVADLCLCVPSQDAPRIQEAHILIGHTLSEIVEAELFQHQRLLDARETS
jgi:D-sedoheptulose 7-phosphate isomerase